MINGVYELQWQRGSNTSWLNDYESKWRIVSIVAGVHLLSMHVEAISLIALEQRQVRRLLQSTHDGAVEFGSEFTLHPILRGRQSRIYSRLGLGLPYLHAPSHPPHSRCHVADLFGLLKMLWHF